MTVAELIEHLKSFPPDLPVLYAIHSDNRMLETEDIKIAKFMQLRECDDYFPNFPNRPHYGLAPFKQFEGVSFPGN